MQEPKNILFLIIRSGSVTGLLSSTDKLGISQFHEIKKDIVFDNTKEHKSFDTETYKIIEEVLEVSIDRKLELPLPDKVVCVYSSPWFDSQISEYDIPHSKKGFKYSLLKEVSSDASNLDDDVELVEQNIESISLNGYVTNSPEGQKYDAGVVTFLTSWITKDTKEGIESVIHRVLNDREIEHMTLPKIINTVVGSHNPSYHLLDIHGEATDIINIQDDNIDSTGSIPLGVHSLVRSLQKEGQEYHEAYEELVHILKDFKDPIHHRKEKDSIKETLLNWSSMLNDIPDFRENNNVILMAQNSTEKLFADALYINYPDHNVDITVLDKEFFNAKESSLTLTSIILVNFWNILEKRGVRVNKK